MSRAKSISALETVSSADAVPDMAVHESNKTANHPIVRRDAKTFQII